MNICIVSNFKQTGYGESTRPGQLAKHLKALGHNILHICDWSGTANEIMHLQVERESWNQNTFERGVSFLKTYWAILHFNPDLIYVHQFNNAKWAVKTKLFRNRKIVFDAHTSAYFEYLHFTSNQTVLENSKNQEAAICKAVNFTIAVSAETKDFLVKTYQLDSAKIDVVGNATDILPISSPQPIASLNFVCLSTLPQDGFPANKMALDMLLEIAAETYAVNKQIQFYVIGGGKMPEAKTPNVFYTGYVTDLRQTILNANICLMPFPENAVCGGARNKFCDYIALGKTVITTNEGLRGMEVLIDKKNCVVANEVSQFVTVITDLHDHRTKLQAIENEVYSIRNYYSWADRAKKVETVFKRLLQI